MKKSNRKVDIIVTVVLAVFLCAAVFYAFSQINNESASEGNIKEPVKSIMELNDPSYTVGINTGTSAMFLVEEYLPEAKVANYEDNLLSYEDVRLGRIDAYIDEREHMQIVIDSGYSGVKLLDDNLGPDMEIAVGISRKTKVPDLKNKLNEFIAELNREGTLEEMYNRWVYDRNYEMPDIPLPENPDKKVVIGTTGLVEPHNFYVGEDLTGFDIELSKRFAYWMNADIEYKIYSYSSIIAAAETGEIDCIFADLNVTSERKEVIDFSDPVFMIENTAMVVDTASINNESSSIFEKIAKSFEKNFIREDRYKLIIEGVMTTVVITFFAAVLGSLLAFGICLLRRTGSQVALKLCRIYLKLLQGTPIVVFLMILYYIVFGKSGLNGIYVAIIGFMLIFGANASEIMRSGIESIDNGQREAALALGYSENQAFFKFIFPQALERFLPVYNGEIVALLKNTSIVGYIAIQDLTKMGDIIRSRTYEAFFPLIVIAIIYFILSYILILCLKHIAGKIAPERKGA